MSYLQLTISWTFLSFFNALICDEIKSSWDKMNPRSAATPHFHSHIVSRALVFLHQRSEAMVVCLEKMFFWIRISSLIGYEL